MNNKYLKHRALISILVFFIFCPLVLLYVEKKISKVFLIVGLILIVIWNLSDYLKSYEK